MFTLQELSSVLNNLLVSFRKQRSCSLLPKYAVVYLSNLAHSQQAASYQCGKLWRSIEAYKGTSVEVEIFDGFLNQMYGTEVIDFYLSVRFRLTSSCDVRWLKDFMERLRMLCNRSKMKSPRED
eukprot:TRINITY_DN9879_c0_g2_i1.p1 TRINITY_DN9879_c0_g2~~TRINITY_DN9879_c0_g2_i1.p1  ORF type:complete len:124 (-),score=17.47 TRINITY_DN9879_c0_g2_i1:617-988(-)